MLLALASARTLGREVGDDFPRLDRLKRTHENGRFPCAGSFFRQAFRSMDTWRRSTVRHPWGEGSEHEAVKRWILDSVWAAGAHLMGRVTYEEMAAFWPTSTSEYARPMNEIPKVVFSKRLQRADWPETRIACGDLSEEIGRLKREPGNDLIAYGGATFDQALSRLGLVDEYRLMIQPAALGAGLPLFKDLPAPLHLELVEATTYATGVAIHVYRPRSTPADQPVDPDQPEQVG
jgi:dihydrofolate reductase